MTLKISTKFAMVGLAALTLAACENPDAGYRNPRQGVGVGALVGAATGAIIGGDAKGAAIGGIVAARPARSTAATSTSRKPNFAAR